MPQRNYWTIRLGEGNKYSETAYQKKCIAVGWRELDRDLSEDCNLDQIDFVRTIAPQLQTQLPGRTEKYYEGSARQLYKFAALLRPEDIVLVPSSEQGEYRVGVVRSDYHYTPAETEFPYRHRRDVEWIAAFSKDTFSEALRNSLRAQMTVFNISRHGEEIERLLGNIRAMRPDQGIENIEEFGMESHLEDFIVENWNRITAFKDFDLYEEDGETVGQQYSTNIGRIDILARSKDRKQWLVIELKKGRTSDNVVGQTLRYIGWIKRNEARPDEIVNGMIVAGERDERLEYALETLENVSLMTYSVSFDLKRVGRNA
ncbi:MAG: hypothetical protein G01um101438_949 [Parcubacteria group bacterium Gr01-1014_38]|nr:MAG: hypothetical protein G01um101438_949 [Parcubacteria group bacterium Gr01-1014_38]